MTCSKIQKKLALFEKLTSPESEHVQQCQHCRAFLGDMSTLRTAAKIATPAHLQAHSLQKSLRALEAEPEVSHSSFFGRLWQAPQTVLILAGFSILAIIITILYQLECDRADILCRVSAYVIIFILVQNIIAAFCAPLFFQHKNILYK